MKYTYDTNALISFPQLLDLEGEKIISEIAIRELDKLKMGLNETAFRARQAIKKLKCTKFTYDDEFGNDHVIYKTGLMNADDLIIECARKHNATLITGDYVAQLKAQKSNVEVYDTSKIESTDDYKGFIEVKLSEQEMANFYEDLNDNKFKLYRNQYIFIKDINNDVIEIAKWDGQQIQLIHQKGFKTTQFGSFKPLDEYQVCAIDSLFSNKMTMIKGKAGSGKSHITLNYAWSQIEKDKYSKLIIFTNPVASRNSARLGFYPGTRDEKLLNSQTGTMLASKFGDIHEVMKQISHGKLMLLPFADIRGFDTTGMNAIIWFIECQNLDIDLMKLGIQRIGNDCKAILDGDYTQQVDQDAYAGSNNGMKRVSEIFRDHDFYGEIELQNVHRSKMAEIADLL